MVATTWPTSNWPQGVSQDVTDYEKPLFSILDDSARDYPNQVYTIFNDATRTYAQVKDTSDRIANFLASRGIRQGDRAAQEGFRGSLLAVSRYASLQLSATRRSAASCTDAGGN